MMDISFLPKEILALIFSYTDIDTIFNIRQTSRLFYLIVEKNYIYLPKVRIKKLEIEAKPVKGVNILNINFIFFKPSCVKKKSRKCYRRCVFKNITTETLEFYLKRICLKNIDDLSINVEENTEVFKILDRYTKLNMSVGELRMSIKRSPVFEHFIKFINKLTSVKKLYLYRLCFASQKIEPLLLFPNISNLEIFEINECQCTEFINSQLMLKLLHENTNIKQVGVISNDNSFYGELIKTITKKRNDCVDSVSGDQKFLLNLSYHGNLDLDEEFGKFFDDKIYSLKKISSSQYCHTFIKVLKKYEEQKREPFMYIQFKKFLDDLKIKCQNFEQSVM